MPRYDRQCGECQELFEVSCKIAEKSDPHVCPECGSTNGEWVMSSPHFSMRPERYMTTKKDRGFVEVISKIQERNKRTSISQR